MNIPMITRHQLSEYKRCLFRVATLFLALWSTLPTRGELDPALHTARDNLFDGRAYLAGFPDVKNRRAVRDDYLGSDTGGHYDLSSGQFDELRIAIDGAVAYRNQPDNLNIQQLHNAQLIAWESLEAMLQGQLISGNFNLLKGLRVAFPNPPNAGLKPKGESTQPSGTPSPPDPADADPDDGGYKGARINDLLYARLHFQRGVVAALEFMASDSSGEIRGSDFLNLPSFGSYTEFNNPEESDVYEGNTNFDDNVACQTTAYLLGNLLDRYGKANTGIGNRLWKAAYFDNQRNPQNADATRAHEREEMLEHAANELRKSAHFQFLTAIPLATVLSDGSVGVSDFEEARIDQARVTVDSAAGFIDKIRRREAPKLESFDVLASTSDINLKLNHIRTLREQAQLAFNQADEAIWKARQAEDEATTAALALHDKFSVSLDQLSGIDPDDYNSLTTSLNRRNYRSSVYSRILQATASPGTALLLTDGSELGKAVITMQQAFAQIRSAENRVDSIPEQIKIIEAREGHIKVALNSTAEQIGAHQLAIGMANSVSISYSEQVTAGFPPSVSFSVSATVNPGAITAAEFQADITRAQALQSIWINRINAIAEIKNLLLQQNQYLLDLKIAVLQGQLAIAGVNGLIAEIDRLIEDHGTYQAAYATYWWSDPAIMFERELEELEYDQSLTEYVQELYVLAQLLGARWSEPYENPYFDYHRNPVTLGSGIYDNYTQPESIFNAVRIDEAESFYAALQAWDTVLRSERNEGNVPDYATAEISLRQDIFRLSDVVWNGSTFTVDPDLRQENIRRFRATLLRNADPSDDHRLQLQFPIICDQKKLAASGVEDPPSLIPVGLNDWNPRVTQMRARIEGNNTVQSSEYRLELYQYGKQEFPGFFPRNTLDKQIRTLNLPLYYDHPLNGTSPPQFRFSIDAKVGTGTASPTTTDDMEPTPFCDNWVLLIEKGTTLPINFHNVDDIKLYFQLKSGRPPAFAF